MATKTTNPVALTDAQLAQALRVFEQAGVVQVKAARVTRRLGLKVIANQGSEAQKYGDITIGKETELGGFLPKVGLNVEDVEPLIKALRAAKKATPQG